MTVLLNAVSEAGKTYTYMSTGVPRSHACSPVHYLACTHGLGFVHVPEIMSDRATDYAL